MNTKVKSAIEHLNKLLPLAERQKSLSIDYANVYRMILNSYVILGRSLSRSEIAEHVDDVGDAINVLRSNDMVVFDSDDEPVGAYPFTMEQRDHKVEVNGNTVYSMCALDALAISPMFDMNTTIHSVCHVSGGNILIELSDQDVLNPDENKDLHFGISWNSASNNCCATSLCTEMIFLKNYEIASSWLQEDPGNHEIFSLDEAIAFAAGFFKPLLTAVNS